MQVESQQGQEPKKIEKLDRAAQKLLDRQIRLFGRDLQIK